MKMKIYLAHPISGLSYSEVVGYYRSLSNFLSCGQGWEVFCPMTAKGHLRNEIEFKVYGYDDNPTSTNRAIVARDHWMVSQADVVHVDLQGSGQVSIGCISELAWAFHMRKHVVLVMGKDNVHRHAFTLEMADIIFPTLSDSKDYLIKLINGLV